MHQTHRQARKRIVLMTGFPGFIGRWLARRILLSEPHTQLLLLTQDKLLSKAQEALEKLPPEDARRCEILTGDIVSMDLGLSGEEYKRVTQEVTDIYHLAAIFYLGVDPQEAQLVNVEGTRKVLDLARECKQLVRFNHFSTCYVSGDRVGVITEEELDQGQQFRNHYERTKHEAEVLVNNAREELPITIFRPSIVVGDSKSGEIDRFDGIYHIGILVVASPVAVPLPLPGEGVAPLNMVPVDFVADATYHISLDPRGVGRTFHIVDPNPLSSRRIYELFAERSGKRVPKLRLSYGLTRLLLRIPGIEKVSRQSMQALDYLNHLAIYNCPNTLELLEGTGILCPRFETYVDNLTRYVRRFMRSQERASAEIDDPLDL